MSALAKIDQNMPSDCPGITEIPVRDLLKSVSGIYRNHCPAITEKGVRELVKPARGTCDRTNKGAGMYSRKS
jgi:hypothetical protein